VYVSRKTESAAFDDVLTGDTRSLDNFALYEGIYGMARTTSVFSPLLDANASIFVSVHFQSTVPMFREMDCGVGRP
jgi:hypothetical protein